MSTSGTSKLKKKKKKVLSYQTGSNNGGLKYIHTGFSCRETAKDKCNLKRLGITHVLNAAEGTWNNVDTGAGYYGDMDIVYHGVVAEDVATFDLSQYFFSAAEFIRETLRNPQSKTT